MIELSVSLASNGVVKVPGYEQLVRFGYTKNRGVYRLHVDATGEWAGLAIRCFWHVPDGKDPASSLVVDGYVAVPASVTAQPGSGCVTFEGSDGAKTVTSADLRYRVSANSGTLTPPPQSRPRPMHRRQHSRPGHLPVLLPQALPMLVKAPSRPQITCKNSETASQTVTLRAKRVIPALP